jgi:predicted nucleotidyltransferase
MKKILSDLVVRSNKFQLLKYINSLPYKFGLNFILRYFKSMPEIKSIYLRRGMTSKDWVPGSSDIDLLIITKKMGLKNELAFLKSFWERYLRLKKIFPFLGEAGVCNENELDNWHKFGGIRAMEMNKWKLLCGSEIRKGKYSFDPLMLRIEALWEALSTQYSDFLSSTMFYQKSFKKTYLRPYFKIFIDILRYGSYCGDMTKGEICDRNQFISNSSKYIRGETKKVIDLFKKVQNSNYFSPKSEEIILNSFSNSFKFLDNICGCLLKDIEKSKISSKLKFSKYNLEPKSKEIVLNTIKPFVDQMYYEIKESVESIILSSSGCRDHRYLLYVILKNDLSDKKIQEIFHKIKNVLISNIDSWPFDYFDLSKAPLLYTKNMFKCHLYLPWWSLEYFYLIRHGETLKGRDLIKNLDRPDDYFVLKGVLSYASYLPIHLKLELRNKQVFSNRIIDDVCGDLPAIILALERGIIPTTPLEAVLEYRDNYKEFGQWLNSFYDTYSKMPIKELEKNFDSIYGEAYPFIRHWLEMNIFKNDSIIHS